MSHGLSSIKIQVCEIYMLVWIGLTLHVITIRAIHSMDCVGSGIRWCGVGVWGRYQTVIAPGQGGSNQVNSVCQVHIIL